MDLGFIDERALCFVMDLMVVVRGSLFVQHFYAISCPTGFVLETAGLVARELKSQSCMVLFNLDRYASYVI